MNCKESLLSHGRGRNRFARGRNNVVNIQRPLMGPPRKPAPRRNSTAQSTSSSNIVWKNPSCQTVNTTILRTSSSRSHSHSYSTDVESRIIIALSEGRGEASCEVGIAAIDVSRPMLVLSQISDSQSYVNTLTKINILNPQEILIPLTFVESFTSNRLISKIKAHFKDTRITAVPRSTFNKLTGIQYVQELCAPQWNSVLLILQHKYYALAAAAALLNYTETVLYVVYANQSIKVEYHESEGFTMIDVATADKLELVASLSLRENKKYSSLLGILNYCLTKIGSRTLRASILQPPCSVPDIEARLECITELKRNPPMMANIQSVLLKLSNIDQILSLATFLPDQEHEYSERQLNYILMLNTTLEAITPLRESFENSKQPFFIELRNTLACEAFMSLRDFVRTMIHSDAHPAKGQQGIVQRCFAIKPGVNSLLDIIRKLYSERADEMNEYVKSLGEKYNLALSLSNNNKKGYHIVLKLDSVQKRSFKRSQLPPEFIQVDRLANTVTMKTQELINFSARIYDILLEILKLSNIMIYNMLIEVRGQIGLFYKLCEDIAKLDMIQSLAQASSGINYIRPKFREYLEVTNSRHPLLDFLCSAEPTSNSFSACKYYNMHIITGPNGSGKSIFIRQILLLQVMAQVGCFVPAESATFRVCDRILARISFDGNMDYGASSFALEVKEIEYFQAVMSKNTLIIIDELCRSTVEEEGTTTAMAICEDLAKSSAYVFFTTHFLYLTKIKDLYFNIKNWQLETIENTKDDDWSKLEFTYNVIPGVTSLKKYGLFTAKASWPENVWKIAEEFLQNTWQVKQSGETELRNVKDRLKYDLESDLKLLKLKKQLTVEALNERLHQYLQDMEEIGIHIDITDINKKHIGENSHVGNRGHYNFGFDKSADYENYRMFNSDNEGSRHVIEVDVHRNFSGDYDQNKMPDHLVFSPIGNNEPFTQETDIASKFNESILKDIIMDSTYIAPEIVYSEVGSHNNFNSTGEKDPRNDDQKFNIFDESAEISQRSKLSRQFSENFNRTLERNPNNDQKFHSFYESAEISEHSKLSRQFSENFNRTLVRNPNNNDQKFHSFDESAEISQRSKLSRQFSENFNRTLERNPNNDQKFHSFYESAEISERSKLSRQFSENFNRTLERNPNNDVSEFGPTFGYGTELLPLNEEEVSFMISQNFRNRIEKAKHFPIENQGSNFSHSLFNGNKFQETFSQHSVQDNTLSIQINTSWNTIPKLADSTNFLHVSNGNGNLQPYISPINMPNSKTSNNSSSSVNEVQFSLPLQTNIHKTSTPLIIGDNSLNPEDENGVNKSEGLKSNFIDDAVITTAIEDLQSCSEYFTDYEEWDSISEDTLSIISQENVQKELCPTQKVGDSDLNGKIRNDEDVTSKIKIHSMYTFDKNNKLIEEIVSNSNENLHQNTKYTYISPMNMSYRKTSNNSLSSVNEVQFSLPLQTNIRKTSTPIISHAYHNSLNSEDENGVNKSERLKTNFIDDADITTAIEDLQSCSEYFTDAEEWDSISEDTLSIISQENVQKELCRTQKVADGDLNGNVRNAEDMTSKIKVHSIYTFDKNNKLIKEMVSNSNENLHQNTSEVNVRETKISSTSHEAELDDSKMSKRLKLDSTNSQTEFIRINTSMDVNASSELSRSKTAIDSNKSGSEQDNSNKISETEECTNFFDQNNDCTLETSELAKTQKFEVNSDKIEKNENDNITNCNTPSKPESVTDNSKKNALYKMDTINEEDNVIDNSQNEKIKCFKRFGLTRQIKTIEKSPSKTPQTSNFGQNINIFENLDEHVSFSLEEHCSSPDIFESAFEITPKNSDCNNTSSEVFRTPEICRKKMKFKTPLKTNNKLNSETIPTTKQTKLKRKIKQRPMKFKPPKMLTKREIEQEYYEQDKKMLESCDPDNVTKYMEQIMNRPNVRQLQQQKQLAVIHKTNDGLVVTPIPTVESKRKKLIPLRKPSVTNFDVTMLSDKNSEKFEEFLQCNNKSLFNRTHSFDLPTRSDGQSKSGIKFNFSSETKENLFGF